MYEFVHLYICHGDMCVYVRSPLGQSRMPITIESHEKRRWERQVHRRQEARGAAKPPAWPQLAPAGKQKETSEDWLGVCVQAAFSTSLSLGVKFRRPRRDHEKAATEPGRNTCTRNTRWTSYIYIYIYLYIYSGVCQNNILCLRFSGLCNPPSPTSQHLASSKKRRGRITAAYKGHI